MLAGLLLWSVVVIGVLTLIPANGAPGIVSAEGRLTTCSWDIGGPAPDGFWILPGGQRMLNALVFVPAGVLLVLVAARWKWAWATIPLGLGVLAAYSFADRVHPAGRGPGSIVLATSRTSSTTSPGAVVGVLIGIALLPVVRAVADVR